MRLHATHDVTILGERVVGENELGEPITETDAPLVEAPGRVDFGGTEFVVTTTGERVRQSPTVVLPTRGTDPKTGDRVDVLDRIEEGNDVQLDGGSDRWRVEGIDPLRGRGHRTERVSLSLAKHS